MLTRSANLVFGGPVLAGLQAELELQQPCSARFRGIQPVGNQEVFVFDVAHPAGTTGYAWFVPGGGGARLFTALDSDGARSPQEAVELAKRRFSD